MYVFFLVRYVGDRPGWSIQKPRKGRKKATGQQERERERGRERDRDKTKFLNLRFKIRQVAAFGKGRICNTCIKK